MKHDEDRSEEDLRDEAIYRADQMEDERWVKAFEAQAAEAAAKDSTDSGRLIPRDL